MKITAAILQRSGAPRPYAQSRPLEICEVDLEGPGAGEVLVKLHAAGLCHSDLSVIDGTRPRPLPMALGHEAAGEIIEVGQGVTRFRTGDHVVLIFMPACGHCRPCATGRPALCEPGAEANGAGTLLGGARRLTRAGAPLNHHLGVSAFATHAVVSENSCVAIDKALPYATAALFGCAVLTGIGAVVNTAAAVPGTSMAVIGLGGVGLSALLGAKLSGARQIIALDTDETKLARAMALGATHVIRAGTPATLDELRDISGGGVDYAFEMAGSVPALELAYGATARGGTTVTAGLPPPDRQLSLQALSLVAAERTLKGSYMGSSVPARDVPRYIALHQQGLIDVDPLLTHRLPLSQVNEGFDRLADGDCVRQVIELG
ncbi:MAG: zinc-dependent alcohol dehydrogenase family protein [Hyphomicrobiales bacterium]|nr:zinc-dependent alcohol dehydrogenase family protein [Hyphomicrobiales bacterium]